MLFLEINVVTKQLSHEVIFLRDFKKYFFKRNPIFFIRRTLTDIFFILYAKVSNIVVCENPIIKI